MTRYWMLSGLICGLILTGCGAIQQSTRDGPPADGKYDSFYPGQNAGPQLEKAFESIQKIAVIVYYQQYQFYKKDKVTRAQIRSGIFRDRIRETRPFHTSVVGTASILFHEDQRVALLTSAHVVDKPDTLMSYFAEKGKVRSQYIQTVSLRTRHNYLLAGYSALDDLEVLAIDQTRDLALVGMKLPGRVEYALKPLSYPFGEARRLEWGSFVYLLGYPWGKRMVTAGLASPTASSQITYTIDAPFNQGMSGGIVLAIRDGWPNLEVVGLTNSASGKFEARLAPPDTLSREHYSPDVPYGGESYVRYSKQFASGVTNVVSVDAIKEFLRENEGELRDQGYDLRGLYR